MTKDSVSIIIPAYEPSWRFVRLIQLIRQETDRTIIVVNDGSGNDYDIVFMQIQNCRNVYLLHHRVNEGKGAALKTAFTYQLSQFPNSVGVVTADSDGQHSVKDIIRLCEQVENGVENEMYLGTRSFNKDEVPSKSYWGNKITSKVFQLLAGVKCEDTQTGLRGISQATLPFLLAIDGDRFEYEMNMLLAHKELGITLKMLPIETIYLENNEQSHFRPIKDAIRIYWPIVSYAMASIISALVDFSLFYLLLTLIWPNQTNLLEVIILSRVGSGLVNFGLNKVFVFKHKGQALSDLIKYVTLFVTQLFLSWFFIQMISSAFGHLLLVKILVDTCLFVGSFLIQQRFIFKNRKGGQQHAV